jgi:hypothetical protein
MPFAPPSATGLRCPVSNDRTARGWSCLSAEPDKRGVTRSSHTWRAPDRTHHGQAAFAAPNAAASGGPR